MDPKRIVFMNVPIITAPGAFVYRTCSGEYAASYLEAFDVPRLSAVGHQSSAAAMTLVLGETVDLNRIEYKAKPGDVAIILKLNGRLPEGVVLDSDALEKIGYHFGLLSMPVALEFDDAVEAARLGAKEILVAHSQTFLGGMDYPEGWLRHAEVEFEALLKRVVDLKSATKE